MGKTVALTATVTPSNATDKTVTFKSADETLATVNNEGVVTGVKATEPDTPVGIVVTTNDGKQTDTAMVTVTAPSVGAKAYSNNTDFGDYDYSGSPNLMPVLKAKDFNKPSGVTLEDVGNGLNITFTKTDEGTYLEAIPHMPALLPNTQYTLSADFTVSEGYTGKLENLKLGYRKFPTEVSILSLTTKDAQVGTKTKLSITANSSSITDPSSFDRMYFTIGTSSTEPFAGTVLIENIKLERGSKATPYQPNLLDEPYWLGKTPLGENIANKDVQFPINTTEYNLYSEPNTADYILNQEYTVSMKATKPGTQDLVVYVGTSANKKVTLSPVEGLADVWEGTFTVDQTDMSNGVSKQLNIFQYPTATKGNVAIEWVKLEKGDTRTPNISHYNYEGTAPAPSNNPKDYHWVDSPSYMNAV